MFSKIASWGVWSNPTLKFLFTWVCMTIGVILFIALILAIMAGGLWLLGFAIDHLSFPVFIGCFITFIFLWFTFGLTEDFMRHNR